MNWKPVGEGLVEVEGVWEGEVRAVIVTQSGKERRVCFIESDGEQRRGVFHLVPGEEGEDEVVFESVEKELRS